MLPAFSPCAFEGGYETLDPYFVVKMTAQALAADWDNSATIERAERQLYDALRAGELAAYVHPLTSTMFYRIPPEYFCDDNWWQHRLDDRLGGFFAKCPAELADKPVILKRGDVETWIAISCRPEGVDDMGQEAAHVEPGHWTPQTKPSTKLPIWPNIFQVLAWVWYRDEPYAERQKDWDSKAGASLFDKRPKIGSFNDLESKLQSGGLPAFGSVNGGPMMPIPAVEWVRLAIAPLDLHRQHPYGCIVVSRDDLFAAFPPTNMASPGTNPPLSNASLHQWWDGLEPAMQTQSQVRLLQAARDAHPGHHVTRKRIRELTPERRPGRRTASE